MKEQTEKPITNKRWYPNYHIVAPYGWINDPNGLSFFKNRYQVFFQHNPSSPKHENIHWGHVSSKDLINWKHEPIALAPSIEADRDGVFSGSAIIGNNGKLYAFYTGNRNITGGGNLQVQCLATSEDGINFEKQGVIIECPEGIKDFRDPKVWKTGDSYFMVIGVRSKENRGQVWLYTSENLKDWKFDRVLFQDSNPDTYMLECPDLFPLEDKWVLIYCPMGPKKDGFMFRNSHNAGYVVGEWNPNEDFKVLVDYRAFDWGHNFYAPQTFLAPDNRRLMFAWIGAFDVPVPSQEDGWCGQLTVPRELTLDTELNLINQPVKELESLRTSEKQFNSFELGWNETFNLLDDADSYEIYLNIDLSKTTAERVCFNLCSTDDNSHTLVAYDDLAKRITLDRHLAKYGDKGYRSSPYSGESNLKLHIFVDKSTIEVFVNDCKESLTSFVFPSEGKRSAILSSESGKTAINSIEVYQLKNIWES